MILHILGGGPGQLSAVKKCRALGITSFVTDKNLQAPGALAADYSAEASTFSAEETIRAAGRFQIQSGRRIDALLVTGTDQPVLTAAETAEHFGIRYFLSPEQARLVTNKKAMKTAFTAAGIPSAPFRFIAPGYDEDSLEGLCFPLVSKPLDSQGQRGVYRLDSPEAVGECINEVLGYSRKDEILIEEYYPSDEITLSGWLEGGRLYILSVTDRVTIENPPSIGVCVAHHYPSKYSKRIPEIRQLTEKIISNFGISDGPVYFQYLIGLDGLIIVNETACRLGGAYEDEFLPYITGIDILDVMIRFSCGLDYDSAALKAACEEDIHADRVVSLQMFFCGEGTIVRQSGMDEVLCLSGVIGGMFLQQPGTIIRSRRNSTQRAGYFIVCIDSKREADEIVRKAYSKLRIEDENGRNMIQFYDKMLFGDNR